MRSEFTVWCVRTRLPDRVEGWMHGHRHALLQGSGYGVWGYQCELLLDMQLRDARYFEEQNLRLLTIQWHCIAQEKFG